MYKHKPLFIIFCFDIFCLYLDVVHIEQLNCENNLAVFMVILIYPLASQWANNIAYDPNSVNLVSYSISG